MTNLTRKLKDPSDVIVEKTAGEFAGVFYDSARSSGMTVIKLQGDTINLLRYKSPREFARRHLEKFIPAAVHALIEIMSRDTTPEAQRQIIYNAVMERINDPDLDLMAKTAGDLPEFENTVLYKSDQEKPKPVIVNTVKSDFNFDNKKVM
jgi:hypothetical protein